MKSPTKATTKQNNTRTKTSRRRRLGLVILITMALLAVVDLGYCFSRQGTMVARATVGGVAVGGLTPAQAKDKVWQSANSMTAVSVTVDGGKPVELTLSGLGISYDLDTSINDAYRYGHEGPWWKQIWQRQVALAMPPHYDVQLKYDEPQLHDVLQKKLYVTYETDAKEVSLKIQQGVVTVIPGVSGRMLDHQKLEDELLSNIKHFNQSTINERLADFAPTFTVADADFAKQQAEKMIASPLVLTYGDQQISIPAETIASWIKTATLKKGDADYKSVQQAGQTAAKVLVATLDQDKVINYVRSVANDQIDHEAANARVQFDNGKLTVIEGSQKGYHVKVDESVSAVTSALWQRSLGSNVAQVSLAVDVIEPTINDQKLADLGITELIGRAETNYSTSHANRKHNIALGAEKVNGTILQPGEEFDLVKTLGEVDAAAGYLPELVISNNKIETQYGGGLCQPTTTLFRAVLDAGLPVTSRINHSRRVSYYEKPSTVKGLHINWDSSMANIGSALVGYDATVFIPEPNLKFVNDTTHAVLIQAVVKNNSSVTFELYGTNDGRQPSITKAVVDYIKDPPAPQFEPDPSKPSMTMDLVEHAVPGAKTHFDYTVTYADGHQNKQTFESFYRPIPDHYLVGTAEVAPAPAPADQPDPNAQPTN